MHIAEIAAITGGKQIFRQDDPLVRHLLIDSRKVFDGEGSLFIAIKGERHDGHDYLLQVYRQGVRNFLVSGNPLQLAELGGINVITVDDTLIALQQIAARHRFQFDLPVIGITGSNGKTIVKEWLWQLLDYDKNVLRSPKSYNSQVGVPLSVWQLNERNELAIFEAGISRPGEMEKLEKIIRPAIGIFTNVREAHIENFEDKEQLTAEKMKLFSQVETLIYCADSPEIANELKNNPAYHQLHKLSWSFQAEATLQINSLKKTNGGCIISADFKGSKLQLKLPFNNDASVENAMHCWLSLLYFGVEHDTIENRMQELVPVAMRLEVKQGINNCILVNDTYNSDLASLNVAVDFLNQQNQKNRKTLILSDIYQTGKNDAELYRSVAALISMKKIDRLIGIGERIRESAGLFQLEKEFYSDTSEFLSKFQERHFKNESILLKGARKFEFEKISERLQQKAHETVLEVNLNALIGNFNYFKSLLNSDTKLMAMVKASSYGTGSYEIANALQYNRADYLGVAYADEGIQLREGGISMPIMVMNPETAAFDAMIRYQLQPELYNFRTLRMFREALKLNEYYLSAGQPFPVHLKLDTGMHRLGFDPSDIDELIKFLLESEKSIQVKSVFSHLSSSDDPEQREFSLKQIASFKSMSQKIIDGLGYEVDRHILNSNGIINYPGAQFEMVRLGIGLYGLINNKNHQGKLRAVSKLKSVVSQLRELKKGDKVGYDQRHVMEKDGTIATIPIGYADGLNRKLGNGNWSFRINGKFAPIVGNVCMDMCMADVTGIDVEEGNAVVIFENKEDLLSMADNLGTIPYEIFTSVSGRVKRIFYEE